MLRYQCSMLVQHHLMITNNQSIKIIFCMFDSFEKRNVYFVSQVMFEESFYLYRFSISKRTIVRYCTINNI